MGNAPGSKRLWLALRIIVPVGACAYLFSMVGLDALLPAMASIPLHTVAAAMVLLLLGTAAAALRWHLLFAACGNPEQPPVMELYRLHLIGLFYNNFVPGGLGGDLVRAAATRQAMAEGGFTRALAVVLLERTLGFTGLVILVAAAFTLWPLPLGEQQVLLYSGLGVAASAAAVVGVASGRRLAPYLPGPFGKIAQSLPTIEKWWPFAGALGLSLVTNVTGVMAAHSIVASLTRAATLTDSLVVVPLTGMAAFFPLTIGGVGVREGAFVWLYGLVGVSQSRALAASLGYFGCLLAVAAVGGVLHALRPLAPESLPDEAMTSGTAP